MGAFLSSVSYQSLQALPPIPSDEAHVRQKNSAGRRGFGGWQLDEAAEVPAAFWDTNEEWPLYDAGTVKDTNE